MMLGALALATVLQAVQVPPVLDFPEPGLDDSAAYQGYQTRFYRDSKRNSVQIYIEPKAGRVVLVWADAANESAGFTVRDRKGQPVATTWAAVPATVSDSGGRRSIEYRLTAKAPEVELGWFVLGSMRIERDFVYAGRQLLPYDAPAFQVAEESLLVAAVGRLGPDERRRHLAALRATSVDELRARLQPAVSTSRSDGGSLIRVARPSLDGRNRLILEIRPPPGDVVRRPSSRTVGIAARGGSVTFSVRVTTDAATLTPLDRREIFTAEFLEFLREAGAAGDSAGKVRARRLERQVRAVELLSSREKLMAGLPNFATYFGRDMMMTALMMRRVWRPAMAEHVIAGVLRKLGPGAAVSHEEALGGQAIREHAVVYDSLVTAAMTPGVASRDSLLAAARELLENLQRTRENYHMVDDEFQLPVLAGRYLADSTVPAAQRRAFLLDSADGGGTRLARLVSELGLVAGLARPYAQQPSVGNLVSFPRRDSVHRRSASWRDSDAGYAGGRYAMDVNAIWVPQALEGIAAVLAALPRLGIDPRRLDSIAPGVRGSALTAYATDSASLRRDIRTWQGARRHFEVVFGPREIEERLRRKLDWLPEEERRYWEGVLRADRQATDTLRFLALSLDEGGRPIPVVNTDPATGLFLEDRTAAVIAGRLTAEQALGDLAPFLRTYPAGLFVNGLGPLVANDAYAPPAVWDRFRKDPYHGPRVVWGREVNLLLLALANQIAGGFDSEGRLRDPALRPYLRSLDESLRRTLEAVHASGLEHNELWSYRVEDGRLRPTRYGTSSDIQLWNITNLAVQFALAHLPRP